MVGRTPRVRSRFHPLGVVVALLLGLGLGGVVSLGPAGALAAVRTPDGTGAAAAAPAPPGVTPTSVPVVPSTTTSTAAPTTTTSAAPPATTPSTPRRLTPTTARVVTAAPRPAPTTTTTAAPAGQVHQASALPAGGADHFAFLTTDQGRPVRYNPCEPIHYVVNAALAPANAMSDLQEAVRRVSDATGLEFVYDGPTTEIPTSRRDLHGANALANGWAPVVIAWARPTDTDLLSGGSVGEGGSTWSGFPGNEVYKTGLVVIDATQNRRLAAGFGGTSLGAVLMHELGHLVGLDHVKDSSQMMYPTVTSKPAAWGAGDLSGLERLGRDAGCTPG
jgi:hypothetical protein